MKTCFLCPELADYLCTNEEIHLCVKHSKTHQSLKPSHNQVQLSFSLSDFELITLKSELKERLQVLKSLKSSIKEKSLTLMSILQTKTEESILKISQYTKTYKSLSIKSSLTLVEYLQCHNIMNSQLMTRIEDSCDLNKFFDQCFVYEQEKIKGLKIMKDRVLGC